MDIRDVTRLGVRVLRGTLMASLALLALAGCTGADDANGDESARAPDAPVGASGTAGKDSASPPQAPAGAAPLVLIAGTSLTAGLGLDPSDAYPAVLQRMADSAGVPARVVNGGLSGETSAGLVRRVDWLLREPPAVVVIETGANDGLRGVDPDSTAANLRRIVGQVRERAPRARILLVQMEAPPNMGPAYVSRFREMYAEVARKTGAGLVPFLLEGVAGDPELNQADGIHPNEEGARLVARTVWGALRPVLEEVDGVAQGR